LTAPPAHPAWLAAPGVAMLGALDGLGHEPGRRGCGMPIKGMGVERQATPPPVAVAAIRPRTKCRTQSGHYLG
jgi:hypothetical protein